MGKRKLCLGLVLGSIVGGLLSLFDQEARDYTRSKLTDVKNGSAYYVKHPSEAVRGAKDTFNRYNQELTNGAENAINALEQVEQTVEQFTNKDTRESDDNI